MKNLFYILCLLASQLYLSQTNILAYRSEYEAVGDIIYDVNDANENTQNYTITTGNSNGYYRINKLSGKISINKIIPDTFNSVQTDNLTVKIGTNVYNIQIVDAYDYFIANLPTGYTVVDQDVAQVDNSSQWTLYNNLWGKGTAVPNQDFRIAIIKNNNFPNQSVFLWDVPGNASTFDGDAVWCYTNLLWGNRKSVRSNLPGFPFKINSINSLKLDFDFEELFGDHQYKVALNLFTTDNPNLGSFYDNRGDFFFIFDQIGTYIPPYPYTLPDINIGGKQFAVLYDDEDKGAFYERRRVIVKNGDKLTSGTLDLKALFDMFASKNYLNTNQSIPNIQVGLEITKGFGAIRFNQIDFKLNEASTSAKKGIINKNQEATKFYPNPVHDKLFWTNQSENISSVKIFDETGKEIKAKVAENYIDFSTLPIGVYYLKTNNKTEKIIKK